MSPPRRQRHAVKSRAKQNSPNTNPKKNVKKSVKTPIPHLQNVDPCLAVWNECTNEWPTYFRKCFLAALFASGAIGVTLLQFGTLNAAPTEFLDSLPQLNTAQHNTVRVKYKAKIEKLKSLQLPWQKIVQLVTYKHFSTHMRDFQQACYFVKQVYTEKDYNERTLIHLFNGCTTKTKFDKLLDQKQEEVIAELQTLVDADSDDEAICRILF